MTLGTPKEANSQCGALNVLGIVIVYVVGANGANVLPQHNI